MSVFRPYELKSRAMGSTQTDMRSDSGCKTATRARRAGMSTSGAARPYQALFHLRWLTELAFVSVRLMQAQSCYNPAQQANIWSYLACPLTRRRLESVRRGSEAEGKRRDS